MNANKLDTLTRKILAMPTRQSTPAFQSREWADGNSEKRHKKTLRDIRREVEEIIRSERGTEELDFFLSMSEAAQILCAREFKALNQR